MNRTVHMVFAAILAVLTAGGTAYGFGQNKVQYDRFSWKYLQTDHFKVFYTGNGRHLADFVAEVAEAHYHRVEQVWHYSLKRAIPIIVYNSHHDFQQTNVIMELLEDEVGGFTELFKNRVVLPYQGSYEDLRHVTEHELTHAIYFEMVYGSNIFETLYNMQNMMSIPLWFVEGLAEYMSLGWDYESDAILRDAVIHDRIRSIHEAGGFLIYKGGQSMVRYIATCYGEEKLGSLLRTIRMSRNVDKAFKSVLGQGLEELDKAWMKEVRRTYWPEVGSRTDPEDVAEQFTDHAKDGAYLNVAPAFLPHGDKIVFLSDRTDYSDIYMMSAIDGKVLDRLVKGERSSRFESMNWLKSRIACASDNRRIAFVAGSGGADVLYIYDRHDDKEVGRYALPFDAMAGPVWSPTEDKIAVTGTVDGQSDLYLVDVSDGGLRRLTDDVFDDIHASFTADGKKLAFASDRPADSSGAHPYVPRHYGIYNIFTLNLADSVITPVTRKPYNCISPSWAPDGNRLVYVSAYNGVSNLFISDLNDSVSYPITNTLTSCHTPNWSPDGKKIVFTQYYRGGWDIFCIRDADERRLDTLDIRPTAYLRDLAQKRLISRAEAEPDSLISAAAANDGPAAATQTADGTTDTLPAADTLRTVLAATALKADTAGMDTASVVAADSSDSAGSAFVGPVQTLAEVREIRPQDYKLEFTPDFMSVQLAISTLYGASGYVYFTLSDILGNHRFFVYLKNNQINIQDLDFNLLYYFLPLRFDVGVGIFHETNRYDFYDGQTYEDRIYGGGLIASYPFNRFNRLDAGLDVLNVSRQSYLTGYYLDIYADTSGGTAVYDTVYRDTVLDLGQYRRQMFQPYISYVQDNVLWGMTGPVNGQRSQVTLVGSPKLSDDSMEYLTLMADWRRYFRFQKRYNIALRVSGGMSGGADPQEFYMGGTRNCWVGPGVASEVSDDELWALDNFYMGHYITPLRGTEFYALQGTGYMLTNLEFRYPFINYLVMGWPLGLAIRNIRGSMFFDYASAWNETPSLSGFEFKDGVLRHDAVRSLGGVGFGGRLNAGFAVLQLDIAWQTDLKTIAAKPRYYFSLGAEF